MWRTYVNFRRRFMIWRFSPMLKRHFTCFTRIWFDYHKTRKNMRWTWEENEPNLELTLPHISHIRCILRRLNILQLFRLNEEKKSICWKLVSSLEVYGIIWRMAGGENCRKNVSSFPALSYGEEMESVVIKVDLWMSPVARRIRLLHAAALSFISKSFHYGYTSSKRLEQFWLSKWMRLSMNKWKVNGVVKICSIVMKKYLRIDDTKSF